MINRRTLPGYWRPACEGGAVEANTTLDFLSTVVRSMVGREVPMRLSSICLVVVGMGRAAGLGTLPVTGLQLRP